MSTLGTIALALAVPTYLLVLHSILSPPATEKSESDPALGLLGAAGLVALWLCLTVAVVAALALPGFNWVAEQRLLQAFIVLAAHAAAGALTGISVLVRHDPEFHVPRVLVPLVPWSPFVFPPVILVGLLLILNPSLLFDIPIEWVRSCLGTIGTVALLAVIGTLFEKLTRRFRSSTPDDSNNSTNSCVLIL